MNDIYTDSSSIIVNYNGVKYNNSTSKVPKLLINGIEKIIQKHAFKLKNKEKKNAEADRKFIKYEQFVDEETYKIKVLASTTYIEEEKSFFNRKMVPKYINFYLSVNVGKKQKIIFDELNEFLKNNVFDKKYI